MHVGYENIKQTIINKIMHLTHGEINQSNRHKKINKK